MTSQIIEEDLKRKNQRILLRKLEYL